MIHHRPKIPVGDDHYFSLDLTPELMLALGDLLEGKKVQSKSILELKTAWSRARRTPLPYATLPWEQLSHDAKRQHISEADAFWDKAKAKDPT